MGAEGTDRQHSVTAPWCWELATGAAGPGQEDTSSCTGSLGAAALSGKSQTVNTWALQATESQLRRLNIAMAA